jgi:hypothetical protein
MPIPSLEQRISMRAFVTGESSSAARTELLALSPNDPVIPQATGDQMRLESAIWEVIAARSGVHGYIGDLTAAIPRANTVVLRLPLHRVEELLPVENEFGDVCGVPGLRVGRHDGSKLILRLAGSDAHVYVSGIAAGEWRSFLDERRSESADQTIWLRSTRSMEPAETDAWEPNGWSIRDYSPSVPSMLLRRPALFANTAGPAPMNSWRSNGWFIELVQPASAWRSHDRVIDALANPASGLPIELESFNCTCAYRAGGCEADLIAEGSARMVVRFLYRAGRRADAESELDYADRLLTTARWAQHRARRRSAVATE